MPMIRGCLKLESHTWVFATDLSREGAPVASGRPTLRQFRSVRLRRTCHLEVTPALLAADRTVAVGPQHIALRRTPPAEVVGPAEGPWAAPSINRRAWRSRGLGQQGSGVTLKGADRDAAMADAAPSPAEMGRAAADRGKGRLQPADDRGADAEGGGAALSSSG
jgi:hypothetical protein